MARPNVPIQSVGKIIRKAAKALQTSAEKMADSGKAVKNSIQTNLTLMNDEFADFLVKNQIGVGSSFDGIYNDRLRGSTKELIRGYTILERAGKKCGFIMVVSQENIAALKESYRFFRDRGISFTINLYIPAKTQANERLMPQTDDAIRYIIDFYDCWINDADCNISIHFFERIIEHIIWGSKTLCKYSSCLGKWVGIRYDGTIVPCNRFFPDACHFGNVYEYEKISDAFASGGFTRLLRQAVARREKCGNCAIYSFCEGGCNNVAYHENGIENNGGQSCLILKAVYGHIRGDLRSKGRRVANPRAKKAIESAPARSGKHCDIHTDAIRDE